MADIVDPTAALRAVGIAPQPESPSEGAETEDQKRIRELEASIAAEAAVPVIQEFIEADDVPEDNDTAGSLPEVAERLPGLPTRSRADRPVPEAELTEDQKRIRQLEDQQARQLARRLDSDDAVEFDKLGNGERIDFYVVQDGWTAFGQVWYRGQEFVVEVGSRAWEDTLDRNGQSFLRFVFDEAAQYKAYGDVMIRRGRWPGQPYGDPRARELEARRNRAVPLLRVGGR